MNKKIFFLAWSTRQMMQKMQAISERANSHVNSAWAVDLKQAKRYSDCEKSRRNKNNKRKK